ncbi:MAG: pyruvate dehydrogenase (acetyl-transferring) E1 component subunit alpha, partial [Opitutales bacterium]
MATKTQKTACDSSAASSKTTDFKAAPINATLTDEEKIDLYRTILGIRRFEERSLQAYNQGKIGGFLH